MLALNTTLKLLVIKEREKHFVMSCYELMSRVLSLRMASSLLLKERKKFFHIVMMIV